MRENLETGDRGSLSPLFCYPIMIEREKVIQLAEERLEEGQFLVELTISASNAIHVIIDGMDGVTISKCVDVSRSIEHNLDREVEDFELQVMTAGLGQPFKIHRQFIKNENQEIEVLTNEGVKLSGKMLHVTEQGFDLEVSTKEKVEGKKSKQLITRMHNFCFEEIKEAKNIIKF